MAALGMPFYIPAIAANGTVASSFKVNGWVPTSAGAPTATRRTFYTDAELTTPASNPATLGASGRVFYVNPALSYAFTITDAAGAVTYDTVYVPAELDAAGAAVLTPLVVSNNAALTALTAGTGLVDNGLYQTLGRASERDGGEGQWLYDSASTTTANVGTILAIDGGGAGRFFRIYSGALNIRWFGAAGDNTADDTSEIQAAYTAIPSTGGTVFWPDGTYKTSAAIVVKANTRTVFSAGAAIDPVALASFTQVTFDGAVAWGYCLFKNTNHGGSGSSVDDNISYDGVRCIPTRGVFSWYGGTSWNGHMISSRNATNLRIENCYCENMADLCSVLKTAGAVVVGNWSEGASNSAYDFWDSCSDVVLRDNTSIRSSNSCNVNTADTFVAVTGLTRNFLIEGNVFYGGRGSGIFVSPLDNASVCRDIRIIGNFFDMENDNNATTNAITVQSSSGVLIHNNTISRVIAGYSPIIVTVHASNVASVGCVITNNTIINSALVGQAYISAYGTRHQISGNIAINSTAAVGVAVDSPTSIVLPNQFNGATTYIVNQTSGGTPTTPAFELTADQTNSRLYFRQVVRSTGGFQHEVSYAVTALGTNLATAYVITTPQTYFSTVAASTGCALPDSTALNTGIEYAIWNQGANTLTVYAQTGDTIEGGASITVAVGAFVRLIAVTSGLWMRAS